VNNNNNNKNETNINNRWQNTIQRGKWRWARKSDYGDDGVDVVGVQHSKGASWEEERDDNRDNEIKDERGRVLANGKEIMIAPPPSASLIRTRTNPRRQVLIWKSSASYHYNICQAVSLFDLIRDWLLRYSSVLIITVLRTKLPEKCSWTNF
jgi:hypothetical protein